MRDGPRVLDVIAGFGAIWVIALVSAFPTLLIANGIFGVDLSAVVNVKMSIVLFVTYVGLAVTAFLLLMNLVTFQLSGVFASLVLVVFLVALPFGPLAACHLYGGIANIGISSFVENDFLGRVTSVAAFGAGLARVPPPSMETIYYVVTIASFLLGLPAAIGAWQRWLSSPA